MCSQPFALTYYEKLCPFNDTTDHHLCGPSPCNTDQF